MGGRIGSTLQYIDGGRIGSTLQYIDGGGGVLVLAVLYSI